MTILISALIAVAIGAGCRLTEIPLPAPPRLEGALLIVAMSFGVVAGASLIN